MPLFLFCSFKKQLGLFQRVLTADFDLSCNLTPNIEVMEINRNIVET